jgi:hypothetical protein
MRAMQRTMRICSALIALCCFTAQNVTAKPLPISETPVAELAKKITMPKSAEGQIKDILFSTDDIRTKPPKKAKDAETENDWHRDSAWILASIDPATKTRKIEIFWGESSKVESLSKGTLIRLPGRSIQKGPDPISRVTQKCVDGFAVSDEYIYGMYRVYDRTCDNIAVSKIAMTYEVLEFLANRHAMQPNEPLEITLVPGNSTVESKAETFRFYPSEAAALILKMNSVSLTKP